MRVTADLNAHAASAGITTAIFYLVGTLPLILAVSDRLALSAELTSSWICLQRLRSAPSRFFTSPEFASANEPDH